MDLHGRRARHRLLHALGRPARADREAVCRRTHARHLRRRRSTVAGIGPHRGSAGSLRFSGPVAGHRDHVVFVRQPRRCDEFTVCVWDDRAPVVWRLRARRMAFSARLARVLRWRDRRALRTSAVLRREYRPLRRVLRIRVHADTRRRARREREPDSTGPACSLHRVCVSRVESRRRTGAGPRRCDQADAGACRGGASDLRSRGSGVWPSRAIAGRHIRVPAGGRGDGRDVFRPRDRMVGLPSECSADARRRLSGRERQLRARSAPANDDGPPADKNPRRRVRCSARGSRDVDALANHRATAVVRLGASRELSGHGHGLCTDVADQPACVAPLLRAPHPDRPLSAEA